MRVLCIATLSTGLGEVFMDAMSFADGEEPYFKSCENLGGLKAGDLSSAFPSAVVLGVCSESGNMEMPARCDRVLEASDSLFLLAPDVKALDANLSLMNQKSNVSKLELPEISVAQAQQLTNRSSQGRSLIVLIGWAADIQDFFLLLDEYCSPGTQVHILSDKKKAKRKYFLGQSGIGMDGQGLDNITLTHYYGNTSTIATISELPIAEAKAVVVLADDLDEDESPMVSDSMSMTSVVHVNRLLGEAKFDKRTKVSVLCELLDSRTQRILANNHTLASQAHFFHSNMLETGMFATTTRNPQVAQGISSLLTAGGPVLRLCGVGMYLTDLSVPVSFYDLEQQAHARGEALLGWREDAKDDYRNFGQLELNPKDKHAKRVFVENDDLVIIRRKDSEFNSHETRLC